MTISVIVIAAGFEKASNCCFGLAGPKSTKFDFITAKVIQYLYTGDGAREQRYFLRVHVFFRVCVFFACVHIIACADSFYVHFRALFQKMLSSAIISI